MNKYIISLLLMLCTGICNAQAENMLAAKTAAITENTLLSLDFNEIPVRQALQLLAQERQFNTLISDDIKGNITLHVHNMPWSKILQIILQQQGLTVHYAGNVMLVAPLAEWAQQQAQLAQAQQLLQNNEVLQSLSLSLRYARAENVRDIIKTSGQALVSARGSIMVDPRTNTLWVEDIPEKLAVMQTFVRKIDIPVQQILIEARLVSLDRKYEEELGIRFGLTRPGNQLTGSLAGANRLAQQTSPAAINPLERLNVDLPVASSAAGSIGLALAKIGGGNLLDVELSALASEGNGEIISSPRLLTGNQQAATILSGQEIPYQQATTSGATSVNFQKAVLNLTVTPQIISSQALILNLHLNQDQPTTTLVRGVPTIETRQIQTQVMINNGETLVLGGIYEQNQEHVQERIPFISRLPLIGKLFQHTLTQNHQRELLIFITPYILPLPTAGRNPAAEG